MTPWILNWTRHPLLSIGTFRPWSCCWFVQNRHNGPWEQFDFNIATRRFHRLYSYNLSPPQVSRLWPWMFTYRVFIAPCSTSWVRVYYVSDYYGILDHDESHGPGNSLARGLIWAFLRHGVQQLSTSISNARDRRRIYFDEKSGDDVCYL